MDATDDVDWEAAHCLCMNEAMVLGIAALEHLSERFAFVTMNSSAGCFKET